MLETIPRSKSRKVNGYVKTVLKLEAVRRRREERYERFVRPLGRQRDVLAAEVATRVNGLTGGQHAEARRILGAIPTVNAIGDSGMRYDAPGCAARTALQRAQPAAEPTAPAAAGFQAGKLDGRRP